MDVSDVFYAGIDHQRDTMSKSEGLQVDDVIQLLSVLADESNLRVTVKESLKGGLITGIGAVLGGLIGGKSGLLLGKYSTVASGLVNCDIYYCSLTMGVFRGTSGSNPQNASKFNGKPLP